DNLAGVTGIGENFLVTGKAGIKNDFAATAATCARRAPLKYSSVFEREYRAVSVRRLQCVLRRNSSYTSFLFPFRAPLIHPIQSVRFMARRFHQIGERASTQRPLCRRYIFAQQAQRCASHLSCRDDRPSLNIRRPEF